MIHAKHPTLGLKEFTLRGIRVNGVNRAIKYGRITHPTLGDKIFWDGSVLPSVTVAASPAYVSGAIATKVGAAAPVTTSSTTASATGGSAPYSFAWTLVSDDGLGGTWSALTPSSATCAFHASAVSEANSPTEATFRCTVTDSRGATGTADITASASNYKV